MTGASGQTLSPSASSLTAALSDRYEIELGTGGEPRVLGQGGMAIVYGAVDVRHRRKVAIKVLLPNVAAVVGAERFLHEIQVTASLQHPHILPLHDSGLLRLAPDAPFLPFYVMPLVEGESLRQRLEREVQLSLEDALTITNGVGSALDYAHRHGVVHRDIKPENILLHEGQPLVADFGIALALSTAGGARLTDTGLALGTPQYMSPEQAAGQRELSGRSDIYALGCVLYEMLAGEPPFTGPTAQAIAAKAATELPRQLRLARPNVPAGVEGAVNVALEKVPADRFATAVDLLRALSSSDKFVTPLPVRDSGPGAAPRSGLRWLLGATLLLAVGIGSGRWLWPRLAPPPAPSVMRFALELNPGLNLEAIGSRIALSPDGTTLVYVGGRAQDARLYVQFLDRLESKVLQGTDGATAPFFSPDGQWIAFGSNGRLKKVALAGGEPIDIATIAAKGGSWGPNDVIVVAAPGGLWRVPAAGGEPTILARPASDEGFYLEPFVFLTGKAVAFAATGKAMHVDITSFGTGTVRRLLEKGASPRYLAGYLSYSAEGALMASPFDLGKLATTGPPRRLTERVGTRTGLAAEYAISSTGTLVYSLTQNLATLRMIDRRGQADTARERVGYYVSPRWSPDGRLLAFFTEHENIELLDPVRGTRSMLTSPSEKGGFHGSVWSPDGRRIAFDGEGGISWKPVDGSLPAQLFPQGAKFIPLAWSPDGKFLLARKNTAGPSLWSLPVDGLTPPTPLTTSPGFINSAAISPNGRWLAYASVDGRSEVYVQPFPNAKNRWQVSTRGGQEPAWSRDGRELYYLDGEDLIAVTVTPGPTFTMGSSRPLFHTSSGFDHVRSYDVHPDGQHFAVGTQRAPDQLIVVTNWISELQKTK